MPPDSSGTIRNPVLPGFNADPSVLRAGGSYWIATSTFEWYPGVALYRSDNLADWELARNILDRPELLDLRGVGESCGIWAPHISYREADGLWCLVYTVVSNLSPSFFDLKNYLVTAADPMAEWSAPVYLNSRGFDPALFHDDDHRSYIVGLAWEFRKGYRHPGAIVLQEFDFTARKALGPPRQIYGGNPFFGCTEGPQIYKRDGSYYLITAEGGTGYGHAALISRSENIFGPYEPSPFGPLLTSRSNPYPGIEDPDPDFLKIRFFNPDSELQKAGHGFIVDTPNGESYLTHLCARPFGDSHRCILNRETGIQKLEWRNGWPRLEGGSPWPRTAVPIPAEHTQPENPSSYSKARTPVTMPGRCAFQPPELPPHFYSLRAPITEDWCSLGRRPGTLSLRGRNSPFDRVETSVIARRIQHSSFTAETLMWFRPESYRHMAGLAALNGPTTWYYLRVYYSQTLDGPALGIMTADRGEPDEILDCRVKLDPVRIAEGIKLGINFSERELRFTWAYGDETTARDIGPGMDSSKLSDEYNNGGRGAFSGTFLALMAQDLEYQDHWASFAYMDYRPESVGSRENTGPGGL